MTRALALLCIVLAGCANNPDDGMLDIGGQTLRVDVPVADLVRFQMQGGEIWPEDSVSRVATSARIGRLGPKPRSGETTRHINRRRPADGCKIGSLLGSLYAPLFVFARHCTRRDLGLP